MPPGNITGSYAESSTMVNSSTLDTGPSAFFTTSSPLEASSTAPLLSPMERHFLVVFVLAGANAILGAIYAYIWYRGKRKQSYNFSGDTVTTYRRQSSVEDAAQMKYKRRKMSTHIALSVNKSKPAGRRMSSAYL